MKKLTLISFLFLLVGCELIVDIDVPFPKAQLTINSFFHADSLWVASLSENQSILDVSPRKRIEHGQIVLYHNEIPIDTLEHIFNGVYRSDNGKPIPGLEYEIRAMAEGYLSVRGRSHIPLPATITNVELIETTTPEGFPETTVRVTFTDDSQATNFYQIFLESELDFIDPTGEVQTGRNRLGIWSDDPIVQNNGDIDYDGIFLKDIVFNGGEGVISFKTTGSNMQYFQNIIVTLRTLSEDYYNYKITGSLQQNTSDNPFAQPVNVHDNIDDGFGIFAGYSEYNYSVGETPVRPVIHSISPMQGRTGDHVIITGENFWNLWANSGTVFLRIGQRSLYMNVVKATPTELEVIVPPNASSGKIYVSNHSRIAASEEEFSVTQ